MDKDKLKGKLRILGLYAGAAVGVGVVIFCGRNMVKALVDQSNEGKQNLSNINNISEKVGGIVQEKSNENIASYKFMGFDTTYDDSCVNIYGRSDESKGKKYVYTTAKYKCDIDMLNEIEKVEFADKLNKITEIVNSNMPSEFIEQTISKDCKINSWLIDNSTLNGDVMKSSITKISVPTFNAENYTATVQIEAFTKIDDGGFNYGDGVGNQVFHSDEHYELRKFDMSISMSKEDYERAEQDPSVVFDLIVNKQGTITMNSATSTKQNNNSNPENNQSYNLNGTKLSNGQYEIDTEGLSM